MTKAKRSPLRTSPVKKVKKPAGASKPKLILNDEQKFVLMRTVHLAGSHINGNWLEVNETFFAQPCAAELKEKHYAIDDDRKIRRAYSNILSETNRFMLCGNKSKNGDDLSPLFEEVKAINAEIEEHERLKDAEVANRRELGQALDANEEVVLKGTGLKKGSNPLRVKNLDGTISDASDNRAPKYTSFETALLNIASSKPTANSTIESGVEKRIWSWIVTSGKDISSLLEEGDVDVIATQRLTRIGLKVMVKIYCTRGKYFDADHFETKMSAMGVDNLSCYQVFGALESWRELASTLPCTSVDTPSSIARSVTKSVSSESASDIDLEDGNSNNNENN